MIQRWPIREEAISGGPRTAHVEPELHLSRRQSLPGSMLRVRRRMMTSQGLTTLAVRIAGSERVDVSAKWRSHLSGEFGAVLPSRRQPRDAAGFVVAEVRYRLSDAADSAWKPLDAVLKSRELSNLVVVLATLAISVYFLRTGGVYALMTNLGGVAVVTGLALAAIHGGRKYRYVKPSKSKPRRKEQ